MKKLDAMQVIEKLGLVPLEGEGGMYLQTYISDTPYGDGSLGTAIYYMLTANSFSHMHKLEGDEIYHFYLGDPVELCLLHEDGTSEIVRLGQNLAEGEEVQHIVPKGTWQGSHLAPGGEWALVGTTNFPGYRDAEYQHGSREELIKAYPDMEKYIRILTGDVKAY